MFRVFLGVLFSIIIGFGFWYLIFWFITAEQNLFIWSGWTKTFYLIASFTSSGEAIKALDDRWF